jgi:uncharacterized caspase-like protein
MRTNAALFASTVRVVAVGVDRVPGGWLPNLAAPERDAAAVADAMRDPAGCAVPPGQVACLTGQAASREAVLAALCDATAAAGPSSTLIFYFAGHGIDGDGDFFLCTADASTDRLGETAVSGADLERALADLPCRGIFVVLDCCQAAGFAERAPRMFRQLERGEFRILLSSARANQRSWEAEGQVGTLFSKHLIAILQAREPVGAGDGAIWFADLLEALERRVAEDMETVARGHPPQEMVFVGAYTRDPLIAVHRGLSLGQIRLQTARYSPAYVRRTVRRTFAALSGAAFFALTVAYGYLEGSQYATEENGRIAIHRGHPDLNLPGYPQRLWVLPYGRERLDLPADKPLRLVGGLGQEIMPAVLSLMRPEFRALALVDAGDLAGARAVVLDLVRRGGDAATPEQHLHARLLLEAVATPEDQSLLEAMLLEDRSEVRLAAVRALLRIDPVAGTEAALALAAAGRIDHGDVLRRIEGPCRPGLERYFDEVLRRRRGSAPANRLVLDAAWRVGCALPAETLLLALRRAMLFETWELVEYARQSGAANAVTEAVLRALADDARDSVLDRANLLLALSELGVGSCPPGIDAALRERQALPRAAAIRVYGALCGAAARVSWSAARSAVVVTAIGEHGAAVSAEFSLLDAEQQIGAAYFLGALPAGERSTLAGPALAVLGNGAPGLDARAQEILVLALLAVGADGPLPERLLDANTIDLRRAAVAYERRRDRASTVERLLRRIGGQDEFHVEPLGRITLKDDALARLRAMLNGSAAERRQAACVLAMQDALAKVVDLLADPDAEVRGAALDCAPFNADAQAIAAAAPARVGAFPVDGHARLREQVARKAALEARLAGAPQAQRLLTVHLTDTTSGGFGLWGRGMRHWLAERRYQLALEDPGFTMPLLLD